MTSTRSSIPRLEVLPRRGSETSISIVSTTRNSVRERRQHTSRTLTSSIPRPSSAASSKTGRPTKSPRDSGVGHLTPPSSRSESEASSASSKIGATSRVARPKKSQLLTLSSGAFRSRTTKATYLETPTAPRHSFPTKRTKAGGKESVLLVQSPTSPYLNAHCSDACTIWSLVHCLSPCGHKVITRSPEPCGSNCQQNFKDEVSRFANVKRTEERFVCATCVDKHIHQHYQSEVESWMARFEETEERMGGFPQGWYESQMRYSKRVLENDIEKERNEFEKLGRPCYHIPGAPLELLERQPVETIPAPWPPSTRPKRSRSSDVDLARSLLCMKWTGDGDELDRDRGRQVGRTETGDVYSRIE